MANQLKMATIDSIQTLHQRGWSFRRIARAVGVHRDTVARYLRQANQAGAPTGSAPIAGEPVGADASAGKLGQAPTGSAGAGALAADAESGAAGPTRTARQASLCQPFAAVIVAKWEQGLTAQRIYQDLVAEHGFGGKYPSVRRFVRRLGGEQALPFRRLECAPGEEVQVDFGTGAPILLPDGKRRRTHVFRIVLSHSRKGYSEAVYRQ